MQSDSEVTQKQGAPSATDMAGLGPLTLLVIGLFSLMFSGPNYAYAIGHIGGRLLSAIAIALPFYMILRYGTKVGRSMATKRLTNIFCLFVALVWGLLAAASAVVPSLIQDITTRQPAAVEPVSANVEPPNQGQGAHRTKPGMFDDLIPEHSQTADAHAATSRPKGKIDWSQYTPIPPSDSAQQK